MLFLNNKFNLLIILLFSFSKSFLKGEIILLTDEHISQSIEEEKALLGAVIIWPDSFRQIAYKVKPDDFYIYRNKIIWESFIQMSESNIPIDLITLCGTLRSEGKMNEIGGEKYLLELESSCPNSMNAEVYADLVREASFNRKTVDMATTIVQNAMSGKSPLLNIQNIENLLQQSQNNLKTNRRLILTTKELCSADFPNLSWFAGGWIMQGGINLIVGMPATGKTFLVLDLAIGLSIGTSVWKNYKSDKQNVLYHYLDGSLRGMHSRMNKLLLGRNSQQPEDLIFDFSQLDLRSSSDLNILKQQIKDMNISVVIFDVFAKFIPGADENSVSDISPVMNSLREISNTLGTTFILLHHLNKGISNDYSYRVRGSSEILGSVDTAIVVTQEGHGPKIVKREIVAQKIREAENLSPLKFQIISTEESISLKFEDADELIDQNISQREEIVQRFIELLQNSPERGFSKDDLINSISGVIASQRTYGRVFQIVNNDPRVRKTKDGTRNLYSWNLDVPTTPLP